MTQLQEFFGCLRRGCPDRGRHAFVGKPNVGPVDRQFCYRFPRFVDALPAVVAAPEQQMRVTARVASALCSYEAFLDEVLKNTRAAAVGDAHRNAFRQDGLELSNYCRSGCVEIARQTKHESSAAQSSLEDR